MMNFKDLGQGEPIVLLHGFLESGKMWQNIANELKNNYRLIIPDLYGHGQTPSIKKTHTMELQAKGVMEVLTSLDIEKATFIGHSMGGYTTLAIARDYPEKVKKLGLFFSSTLPDSEDKKEQRLKAVGTAKENKESFVRLGIRNLFDSNNLVNLHEEIELAKKWALETPLDGITAALRGMRERQDTTQALQDAQYPIQIILGEYDGAIDINEFKKVIPEKENIQVDILPVGHMGHLEAPEKSLEIIKAFLNK